MSITKEYDFKKNGTFILRINDCSIWYKSTQARMDAGYYVVINHKGQQVYRGETILGLIRTAMDTPNRKGEYLKALSKSQTRKIDKILKEYGENSSALGDSLADEDDDYDTDERQLLIEFLGWEHAGSIDLSDMNYMVDKFYSQRSKSQTLNGKLGISQKKFFQDLFKKQILKGAKYIDKRSRPTYDKWIYNRLRKQGTAAYEKGLKTGMDGEKLK